MSRYKTKIIHLDLPNNILFETDEGSILFQLAQLNNEIWVHLVLN